MYNINMYHNIVYYIYKHKTKCGKLGESSISGISVVVVLGLITYLVWAKEEYVVSIIIICHGYHIIFIIIIIFDYEYTF